MAACHAQRFSVERLARCDEMAPPRVQRYLKQALQHLPGAARPGDAAPELGCGSGRIGLCRARAGARVTGIGLAEDKLSLALRVAARTFEIDGSSLWCELRSPANLPPSGAAGAAPSPHRSQ
ncbi:MAG TPA: hypothetical protein PKC97_12265 [Burkholderiaceae bacterium]|jgi:2-polyprenyl-3-methyl-5-hydroxy-6-metoxy-1,4-benzoquinol methylase|nr:hypothetical protein [Burkholderiaceae bacterium]